MCCSPRTPLISDIAILLDRSTLHVLGLPFNVNLSQIKLFDCIVCLLNSLVPYKPEPRALNALGFSGCDPDFVLF